MSITLDERFTQFSISILQIEDKSKTNQPYVGRCKVEFTIHDCNSVSYLLLFC